MTIFYTICAIIGGTILVCQFFLSITGISDADDIDDGSHVDAGADVDHVEAGHHDAHPHHGTNWFFGIITLRTVTAALTFFGLTGLAAGAGGATLPTSLMAAMAAGLAALYVVHWLMRSLALLRAEGTVRIDKAVGAVGSVYVRIPGRNSGRGKVTLTLQGQSVELSATTEQGPLSTGARIVVTRVTGPDAVEVVAADAT
jgi:membrane protein implicated in regulation of membrane protease activity